VTDGQRRWQTRALLVLLIAIYAVSFVHADIDLGRLVNGLPRLASWLATAWPPDVSELPEIGRRALETLSIATLGTTMAALLAVPLCLVATRAVTPAPLAYHIARSLLDGLRAIDAFIFALIFVAAVGLGPFAGILGIGLHSAGSIAKLWSEQLETLEPGPAEAAVMAGAGRLKLALHVLLPDALPGLASTVLYIWEFNVRASTVLGLVGAGGIGQELKNSIDLLDFSRVVTILAVILVLVIGIDRLSATIRRRLA